MESLRTDHEYNFSPNYCLFEEWFKSVFVIAGLTRNDKRVMTHPLNQIFGKPISAETHSLRQTSSRS